MKLLAIIRNFFKKYTYLLITSAIVVVIIYSITQVCVTDSIGIWEERLYKWIQLFLLAMVAFGILRLYNAVVVNSSYINSLNREIKLLITEMKNLGRINSQDGREHRNASGVLRNALDAVRLAIMTLITKFK